MAKHQLIPTLPRACETRTASRQGQLCVTATPPGLSPAWHVPQRPSWLRAPRESSGNGDPGGRGLRPLRTPAPPSEGSVSNYLRLPLPGSPGPFCWSLGWQIQGWRLRQTVSISLVWTPACGLHPARPTGSRRRAGWSPKRCRHLPPRHAAPPAETRQRAALQGAGPPPESDRGYQTPVEKEQKAALIRPLC